MVAWVLDTNVYDVYIHRDAARMPPDPHPPDIVNAGQRGSVGHNLAPHPRPVPVQVYSAVWAGRGPVGGWLY